MKPYIAFVSVLLVIVLAVSSQSIAARDHDMADSAALGETNSLLSSSTLMKHVPIPSPSPSPIAVPSESALSSYFRDIPLISDPYVIGGRSLLLYLEAGFSGGYGSELNRSFDGHLPCGATSGFGVSLGKASPRMSFKWASAFRFSASELAFP